MPNRIIRDGILTSEAVNALSPQAELFYRRLFSVVDDYGCYFGHPKLLLAAAYPAQLGKVTEDDVQRWLDECSVQPEDHDELPLVTVYVVKSQTYIKINKFDQRTRSQKSRFPQPAVIARSSRGQSAVIPLPERGHPAANPPLARADGDGDGDVFGDGDVCAREEQPPPPARTCDELCQEFVEAYPKAGRNKLGLVERWYAANVGLCVDPAKLHGEIMAGLSRAVESREWLKDGGKWLCSAIKFLEAKRWLDPWPPWEDPGGVPRLPDPDCKPKSAAEWWADAEYLRRAGREDMAETCEQRAREAEAAGAA